MRRERRALDQWASATVRGVVARGWARPPPSSSPAAASRGLDSDATGRAGMEAARCAPGPRADRSGAGARAAEGRGGVSRLGGRGPGPGSGLHAGQALSIPRRQHTLRAAPLEFAPNQLALLPQGLRFPHSQCVLPLPCFSGAESKLRWNEVPPGSRSGRSRVMVNWFQGRCFWQSLRNSGTECED